MSLSVASLSQIPAVCDPADPGRKRFYLEGVRLDVPNWLEDKELRWLIDQGQDLVTAYKNVGLTDILPEQGIRDCLYDVLRTKYYDAGSGEWKTTGGNITCIGFWNCFESYVEAMRESQKRGRNKIAEGVYSPSPAEADCIKQRFFLVGDLARAYAECDAADILPDFSPGSVQSIADIIRANPKQHMYDIIKTVYMMSGGAAPVSEEPLHHAAPSEPERKDNTLLYIIGGVAAAFLLGRML